MADANPAAVTQAIHYTTCPLCEATCGLEITTRSREIVSIRGDRNDVFSRGYLCPKAASLKELDADPDRLRQPMVRRGEQWRAVSWEEAFAEVERGLRPILQQHGPHAVATYLGNPNVHNLANQLYARVFLSALGSRNNFTASSVDQLPKQVAVALMFGTDLSVPIPDIDRARYFLVLGANPLVSNGSLMTAPGMRDRIRALRERGGKMVVIDPVRTETAAAADEHHFLRPGTDALLLFAMARTLLEEGLASPGRLAEHANGLEQIGELARGFAPEAVARHCGITAETIRRLARELAAAHPAAVYGRIGTCTQEFGTVASWLVDVLNFLTGNLDREGGALFPKPAAGGRNTGGPPGKGSGVRLGKWKSRVRGFPEIFGQLPAACMAEEMETPGAQQVRALVTIAGNPALSTPNSGRLQRAMAKLEFMVSIDMYRNETTRFANVILPALSPLERSHYDVVFSHLAVRNVAHYSKPVCEPEPGQPAEWQILLRMTAALEGAQDLGGDPVSRLDDLTAQQMVARELKTPESAIAGRDPAEILAMLHPRRGPERLLDFLLRTGPYGDAFGAKPDGLSLAVLEANPHGADLGPLQPRMPEALRTPSGKIELAPAAIVADVERLRRAMEEKPADGGMVLIGRRDLRSNNSWMHNLNVLVKGEDRCTMFVNPGDAERIGLADGEMASVASRAGSLEIRVRLTDAIMPGVVSIPHGWGHDAPGIQMETARRHAGVNSNILAGEDAMDPLSGNAVLNGIPVTVAKMNHHAVTNKEQQEMKIGDLRAQSI